VRPIVREWEKLPAKRRFWLLDARRCEEVLASDAAFLVSVALAIVFSGALAYVYASWTIGPA
jgi:hypothetical protein